MSAPARGHLPQSECQQQISLAYAAAVASTAGCSMEPRKIDYYGVDVSFHHLTGGWPGEYDPSQVEAQVKCTTQDCLRDDRVAYPNLKRKHYDLLRTPRVTAPRIFIVMLVPPDMDSWLDQSEAEMLLAGCAYWVSLRDEAAIATESKTVHLPRENVFDVEALLSIMQRVGQGQLP